jgi:hypothetical protein
MPPAAVDTRCYVRLDLTWKNSSRGRFYAGDDPRRRVAIASAGRGHVVRSKVALVYVATTDGERPTSVCERDCRRRPRRINALRTFNVSCDANIGGLTNAEA